MQFSSEFTLVPKTGNAILKKESYRAAIFRIIKKTMESTDPQTYNELYEQGAAQKQFSTGLYLKNITFEKGPYLKPQENASIIFSFSSDNESIAVSFLNTLLYLTSLKQIQLTPDYDVKVNRPKVQPNNNIGNAHSIMIKTVSPIVINDHQKNKDYFYSVENNYQKFEELLKQNLKREINNTAPQLAKHFDSFNIIPIKTKKTVQTCYNLHIECSTGTFMLSGKPKLLQYIINNGLGSKRGLGFGLIKL